MNKESIKNVSVPYHDAVIEINALFFSIVIYVGVFVCVCVCNRLQFLQNCLLFLQCRSISIAFLCFYAFFMELDIKKKLSIYEFIYGIWFGSGIKEVGPNKISCRKLCVCVVQIKMEINDWDLFLCVCAQQRGCIMI